MTSQLETLLPGIAASDLVYALQVTANPGLAASGSEQVGGLVARDRELSHLDHVLWRARRGMGSSVVLRGEPGTGKSALIEATVARAMDFHVVQLRGSAIGQGTALPRHWPEPLLGLINSITPGGQADPASVAEAASGALRALCDQANEPVLLTIDDCHLLPAWLPTALVTAIESNPEDLSVALVLAWRDLPHVVPFELESADVPEHRLAAVSLEQARTLLGRQHGGTIDPGVLQALVRATGGNPLALLDTCSRLSPDELTGWRPLREPVPIGGASAAAFGRCLDDLPEACRRAVATASAGQLPVAVLQPALAELGQSMEDLQPAQRAGILTVLGNRVEFKHPLVRAAAFRLTPEEVRASIHLAISKAYSSCGFVERSAFHAGQNAGEPNRPLARLFAQSARVALDRGDPQTAASQEELAADFAEDDDAVCRHLSQSAELWEAAGKPDRARVCLERALALQASDHVRAEVVFELARIRLLDGGGPESKGEKLAQMLAAIERCESAAPQRALSMWLELAASECLDGSPEASIKAANRAIVLAGTVSSHAEALAKATLASVKLVADRPSDHTRTVTQLTSLLIGQTERFIASPRVAYLVGIALLRERNGDQAMRWAQWIQQCAEKVGDQPLAMVPPALRSIESMNGGRFTEAVAFGAAAHERSELCGDLTLAARALGTSVWALGARGDYRAGFECATRLFAMSSDASALPRAQALSALAALELQRNRVGSAVAWLRAASDESSDTATGAGTGAGSGAMTGSDEILSLWAPTMADTLVLGRRSSEADELARLVEERIGTDTATSRGAWPLWVRGACAEPIERASGHFESALLAARGTPFLEARIELCWGVRLAEAGATERAQIRIESARARFSRLGADGWRELCTRELTRMAVAAGLLMDPAQGAGADQLPGADGTRADGSRSTGMSPAGGSSTADPATAPPWEINLLGSFELRHRGKPVDLPPSLAAQGLKIVALRRKVPVDELVEELWPEAEPGVGTRRLRNVLWRVRAACGDLLLRDGVFISLAPGAVTDVEVFSLSAERALHRDTPTAEAVGLAREALDYYRGELLPEDRYADWAAASRESFTRTQIQLLELLLTDAVREDRITEALDLLSQLTEADPYEEHYYLQAAELHAAGGNRRMAMGSLAQAERMLADLGMPPSRSLERVRAEINDA